MTYSSLFGLPIVSDPEVHCAYCGERLIDRYEETEYFDRVTGTPYKFQTRTCPNWTPRWFVFGSIHDRVRLPLASEILEPRPIYPDPGKRSA